MYVRINYSVICVSDMARSVAFYRDLLGIPLKFETPDWSEFVTEGATLALHKGKLSELGDESVEPVAGRSRPGFQVADLNEFHSRMIENGVECVLQPSIVYGVQMAQYRDPDGLILTVSGAPKEAA